MIPLFLWLACAPPAPVVEYVTPGDGLPGDSIQIGGQNFSEVQEVTLGGAPVENLEVLGVISMKGQVPAGLGPGAHELVVTTAAGSSSKPGAFRVKEGKVESQGTPCAGEFTAFTKLAQKQKKFVMDRHYKKPEGKREVVEVPFVDVDAIEYEETTLKDESVCSAIWIVEKNGTRHLFDDDTQVKLQKRAQDIANGIQKPLKRAGM